MKEIQINQVKYAVCDDTLLYPSGSTTIRNKIEIHMEVDGLEYFEFEKIFSNKENLRMLYLREYGRKETDGKVDENAQLYEYPCENYTEILSIGRKRIDSVDFMTGKVSSVEHYVVILEQPLQVELLMEQMEQLNAK